MKIFAASAILIAAAFGQTAFAQPPSLASLTQDLPLPPLDGEAPQAIAPETQEAVTSDAEAPLDLDELSDLRGGEAAGIQLTTQNLNAINTGNSVSAGESVGSGVVNLNAGAFSGYDGIGNFVINTGHNNNLMGSVSVNVMVTPQ